MKKYKVVMSEPAANDLRSIAHYIGYELKEPGTARRLVETIRETVMELALLPSRHTAVADERLALKGIRKAPVDNYIVFYIISEKDKTVNIVRILYGSRNWIDLL